MIEIIGKEFTEVGYWIADVDPEELRAAVNPIELVDGTLARPFEARITAEDQFGNRGESPLLTFSIPDENLTSQTLVGGSGRGVVFYDGTVVSVSPGGPLSRYDSLAVTMIPLGLSGENTVDLSGKRSSMNYLDVSRTLEITGYDGDEVETLTAFAESLVLGLHYPTYLESPLLDENMIGTYRYNPITNRWIGQPTWISRDGNGAVSFTKETGTFGLFADSRLGYDPGIGLSGVIADPNPFSPNGDGLYDETKISFFVSRELDWVTIEIYDIAGRQVRTLEWQVNISYSTVGRSPVDIVWDGRDETGETVPYGVYILRVEARFKTAPNNERQNIAVVVIK
jgi:hypothetical protein